MESLSQGIRAGVPAAWTEAVSFPEWAEVLATRSWSGQVKFHVRREVAGFLRHCRQRPAPATIALARDYIAARERQAGRENRVLRGSLRWFFRAARQFAGGRASGPWAETRQTNSRGTGAADGGFQTAPLPRAAGGACGHSHRERPRPAAEDLGGADWEREWSLSTMGGRLTKQPNARTST